MIVTITFNPCIDKGSFINALVPDKKLRCTPFVYEAGGGGINVAKAVKKLGGNTTAVYLAGGNTGTVLQSLLLTEGINSILINTTVDTRENIMMVDKTTNLQYRFITPGLPIEEIYVEECIEAIKKIPHISYMVISGSMPPGVPEDIFITLSSIAKEKNAKLIVDVPTETLKAHEIKNVFLLKPNLDELSLLTGSEELRGNEIKEAAKQIISKGICEIVVVSLGPAGALLVTADLYKQLSAPLIKRKSTVGAGDSMVAGIVLSLSNNKNIEEAVAYGVACGTAATMNEGTQLCNLHDAEKLFQNMQS